MTSEDEIEPDTEEIKEFVDDEDEQAEELLRRMNHTESQNLLLIEDNKRLLDEKRYMESEMNHHQTEIKRLKAEMDRLKNPPLIIGTIKSILPTGKIIIKSTTGPTFIVNRANHVAEDTLTPGTRVALNKQTLAIMGIVPSSKDPIVTGAEIITKPETKYSDIGGLQDQILEIKESVEDPLVKPDLYLKVGIEPPKGVLLIGPPGTGKTMLAKAVANRTDATFIRLVGSELVQKYIGEGARLVRELFELAREKAPSIVFIDELDSIGARRLDVATSGDREVQRTLMQLLAELDGFDPVGVVKLIGATNRPDILDEALLRPGRFDRIIEIPTPNAEARFEIFKIHLKRMNSAKNIDIELLSAKADGSTGADIKSICTEAGMFAIRDDRNKVTMADMEKAVNKVLGEEWMRQNETGVMFA